MIDRVVVPVELLEALASSYGDTPCWFDHHGGCQEHGFLGLEPGEKCPARELQEILKALRVAEEVGGDDCDCWNYCEHRAAVCPRGPASGG